VLKPLIDQSSPVWPNWL